MMIDTLAHQEEQLAHQKDMFRYTIKMLVESGKTPSEIADKLHLDVEDIKELMLYCQDKNRD